MLVNLESGLAEDGSMLQLSEESRKGELILKACLYIKYILSFICTITFHLPCFHKLSPSDLPLAFTITNCYVDNDYRGRWLITARIRRKVMFSHMSVCLFTPVGVPPSQVRMGGGNPIPGQDRGGIPFPGQDGGYPIPGQDGGGYSLPR